MVGIVGSWGSVPRKPLRDRVELAELSHPKSKEYE